MNFPRHQLSAVILCALMTATVIIGTPGVIDAASIRSSVSVERGNHITVALGRKWARKSIVVEYAPYSKSKKKVAYRRLASGRTDTKGRYVGCPRKVVPARAILRVRSGTRVLATRRIASAVTFNKCQPFPTPSLQVPTTPATEIPPVGESALAAPVIAGLSSASDTGVSSNDRITNATDLVVVGTSTAGTMVQLRDNGVNIGTPCVADQSNAFACTLTSVAEGVLSLTAVATVANRSAETMATVSVTVDRTAPTATMSPARSMIHANSSTTVSVVVSERLANFSLSSLTLYCSMVSGCTLTNFVGSDRNYAFTFSTIDNLANGGVVALTSGSIEDLAGNVSTTQVVASIGLDLFGPQWTVEVVDGTKLRMTFDEPVHDFSLSDLSIGEYSVSQMGWQRLGYLTNQLLNLRSVSPDDSVWEVDMTSNLQYSRADPYAPTLTLEMTGQIADEYGNTSSYGELSMVEIASRV